MLETLSEYLSYSFVIYAFIVGILVAFCSSLLGATLVLKRLSFIGDGLAHIAFGSISIATVLDIANQEILVFPVTVLCAIILLRLGQNTKIRGDSAIAMMSVASLAIGYLLMNVFSVSTNLAGDVCTTLFGSTSILTLTKFDVLSCIILSLLVVTIFLLFYNKIFAVTFDENFAKATGVNANFYNLVIAITIGAVIVVAMNLVGSLLISALVVFPALSAMRLFRSFKTVIVSSSIISVFCAFFGIIISILYGSPVGSTIVCMNIALFLLCSAISMLRRT